DGPNSQRRTLRRDAHPHRGHRRLPHAHRLSHEHRPWLLGPGTRRSAVDARDDEQRHGRALQERRSTCAAALTCKVRCVKCEVRVGTRAKRALTLHLTLYTLHYDCEFTVAHRPTSPDLVRLRRPQGFAVATRSDAVSRVGIGSDAAADAG